MESSAFKLKNVDCEEGPMLVVPQQCWEQLPGWSGRKWGKFIHSSLLFMYSFDHLENVTFFLSNTYHPPSMTENSIVVGRKFHCYMMCECCKFSSNLDFRKYLNTWKIILWYNGVTIILTFAFVELVALYIISNMQRHS